MKRIIFLFVTMSILLSGCNQDDNEPVKTTSKLIAKGSNVHLKSTTDMAPIDSDEPIIFTGDDILWFNGTTKEIRFKDNISQNSNSFMVAYKNIKFYLGDAYLFSSLIYASDINSQIFNSIVFYYSSIENRFYIKDGYPDTSVLQNPTEQQHLRDENMKKIEDEWKLFIGQLKKEGKYKE